MAQIRKAEGQIEMKACANKFFDIWAHKAYEVGRMCPDKYPKIELNQGHWHTVGSVVTWNYVAYGKSEFIQTKVEEIDEDRRSVSYTATDGQVMKNYYKSIKTKMQVVQKGESNCTVKWTIEYEKMNKDAPDADIYVDFLLSSAKDMEDHISGRT